MVILVYNVIPANIKRRTLATHSITFFSNTLSII